MGLICFSTLFLLSCVLLWGAARAGWFEGVLYLFSPRHPQPARLEAILPRATPSPFFVARQGEDTTALPTVLPEEATPFVAPAPEPTAPPRAEPTPQKPLPSLGARIIIPALKVDTPIVEVPFREGSWDIAGLSSEVAHLEGTAQPGENANVVMAGHVTLASGGCGPFKELAKLQPGATVKIQSGNESYVYLVDYGKATGPGDVDVLNSTDKPVLTLITCLNWDFLQHRYRDRFIIVAYLDKELS